MTHQRLVTSASTSKLLGHPRCSWGAVSAAFVLLQSYCPQLGATACDPPAWRASPAAALEPQSIMSCWGAARTPHEGLGTGLRAAAAAAPIHHEPLGRRPNASCWAGDWNLRCRYVCPNSPSRWGAARTRHAGLGRGTCAAGVGGPSIMSRRGAARMRHAGLGLACLLPLRLPLSIVSRWGVRRQAAPSSSHPRQSLETPTTITAV